MCRLSVNVDEKKKEAVNAVLKRKGFSMEDAIDLYFDAIIADNNIPEKIGIDFSIGPFTDIGELRMALNV